MDAARNRVVVEQLREEIRKLQAAPRSYLAVLRTGVAPFDGLFPEGGLPLGQALELWGEAASGRTSLALRAVASAGREQRLSAWVDGPRELYPPAAAALGADLKRLLIVRPQAPGQLVWASVQLLRSGAFACVVLDLTHTGVRLSQAEGRKLQDAAVKGGGVLLLLTPVDAPGDGLARVRTRAEGMEGLRLELVRHRRAAHGAQALVPWSALYPGRAPIYSYDLPPSPPALPAVSENERVVDFKRHKKSWDHGCCQGHGGGRPGRDALLPALGPALGVRSLH